MVIGDKQLIGRLLKVILGVENEDDIVIKDEYEDKSMIMKRATDYGLTSIKFSFPLDTDVL